MWGKIIYQAGILLVGVLAILAAILLFVMNFQSLISDKLGTKVSDGKGIEIRLLAFDTTLSKSNLWLIIIFLMVAGLALLFGGTIISKLVERAGRKQLAEVKHVSSYRKVNEEIDYDNLDDYGFIDVSYGEYVEKKYSPKKRVASQSTSDKREIKEESKISVSGRKLIIG